MKKDCMYKTNNAFLKKKLTINKMIFKKGWVFWGGN
jgi:hypothetical protein